MTCPHRQTEEFIVKSFAGAMTWRKHYCKCCGALVTAGVVNLKGEITEEQRL